MNRIFKFRIWNIKSKNWDNTNLLEVFGADDALHCLYGDENYIIQQFTGIKDRNNQEVYEGDIINFTYYTGDAASEEEYKESLEREIEGQKITGEVEWNDSMGGFNIVAKIHSNIYFPLMYANFGKVIGNIFQK